MESSDDSDELSEDEPRQEQTDQKVNEKGHASQTEHAPPNQPQINE